MPNNLRSHIIYIGDFRFPEGDAAAARVLGIGKALRDIGYVVSFAGGEVEGRSEDRQSGCHYTYQGFTYFSTGGIRRNPASPVRRLLHYLSMGERALKYLHEIDIAKVSAVVLYNPFAGYHTRIVPFCRANSIAVVVDCTEWHDPRHYPGGRFGLHRWDVELSMRYLNCRAGNLIAISTYLDRFYEDRGVNAIRVPPLVDLSDSKWLFKRVRAWDERPLRLIYAGNPGQKELMGAIIGAVKNLRSKGEPVVLELVGPTEKDIFYCTGRRTLLGQDLEDGIILHGQVSQSRVPDLLSGAHFAVLLRPNERFAQAGFPTKVVEALAAGLPLITNVTSDIAQYVRDGSEGFLVEDCTERALVIGIQRALRTSPDELRQMSDACRRQAEVSFDYRIYVAQLSRFFSSLRFC